MDLPLTRDELRALRRLRPSRWFRDLALDWGLIVLAFVGFRALGRPWLLLPLFALVIGARMHALALLFHDASHRLALPGRKWNDRLGQWLAGWPLLSTLDHGYRPWHAQHHRYVGTDADPELSYRAHPPYRGPVPFMRVVRYFLTDLAGLGLPGQVAAIRPILPSNPLRFAGPIGLWLAALALCWWHDALWIFALWLWSSVAGFWPIYRIRTWFEHVGLERCGPYGTHRFHAGPLTRFFFFPHNTYCHYEHHLSPTVPYYNLPEMRRLLVEREAGRPVLSFFELARRFDRYDGDDEPLGPPERAGRQGRRERQPSARQ